MAKMMPKLSHLAASKRAERESTIVSAEVLKIPESGRCIV